MQYGHGGQGKFSCPGYFDDDVFKRCGFASDSVVRPPWVENGQICAPAKSVGAGAAAASTSTAAPPAKKSKTSSKKQAVADAGPLPPAYSTAMPGDDD